MNRRDFLSAAIKTAIFSSIPLSAFSKEEDIKRSLYIGAHLEKYTFKELFPKPFYQKSIFGWLALGTTIAVAGAISYFTFGAGAPAAAAGVGSVASWVGGGGAGSYMAGLSAIGSFFGGNAMLGAAILNGISIGLIGGGTGGSLLLASKVAAVMSYGYLGISFVPDENGGGGRGVFDLRLPKREMGSGTIRRLAEKLENIDKKIQDTLEDIQELEDDKEEKKEYIKEKYSIYKTKLERLYKERDEVYSQSITLLKKELHKKEPQVLNSDNSFTGDGEQVDGYLSPENLIWLSVLAYRSGEYELFIKGVEKLKRTIEYINPKNYSYVSYLQGVAELTKENPDFQYAENKFRFSWEQEPYTLEPPAALIYILEQKIKNSKETSEANDLLKEIEVISNKAVKQYDDDEYLSRIQPFGLYFSVASIYMRLSEYKKAIEYFNKSYSELGIFLRFVPTDSAEDTRNYILIMKAVCLYNLGEKDKALELYEDIIDDYEDKPKKLKMFKTIFEESKNDS